MPGLPIIASKGKFAVVVPRADAPDYQTLIRQLAEAQNWRCCYCCVEMTLGVWDKKNCATIEHVVPKSARGSNKWDNLVAACRLCNNARSSMNAEKYAQLVGWKGRHKAAHYAHGLRGKLQARAFANRVSTQEAP